MGAQSVPIDTIDAQPSAETPDTTQMAMKSHPPLFVKLSAGQEISLQLSNREKIMV